MLLVLRSITVFYDPFALLESSSRCLFSNMLIDKLDIHLLYVIILFFRNYTPTWFYLYVTGPLEIRTPVDNFVDRIATVRA